jgi:PAS domain S-box-containing protein
MNSLPNILIVDDTEENLFLLKTIIDKINVNLIMAHSGLEALEKTRGIELALAILDVRMPEMDGFELAVKLNEERLGDKVPVLFLTASFSNEGDEYRGYDSGAVDFIYKPIKIPILLSKIKVFLDLYYQKQTIINESKKLKESTNKLIQLNEALTESEGRLEDIIFTMADWMWEVDENGIYTYCSHHVYNILGYPPKEIIGKTPFDFMSPDEGRRVAVLFSEKAANKSPIKDIKNWNISKDGKKICLLTNGVPIIDKNGNMKGYRGVDRDITHNIEMEESLRANQIELEFQNDELKVSNQKALIATRKYSELYNFAPSGFFTLSKEVEIIELNHNGAKMLGKERSLLLGSHFGFFISENTRPVFNAFFHNVFKSKCKETCELELDTGDKQQIFVHIEGLIDNSGKECHISIIDITSRIQKEKKLHASKKFIDDIISTVPVRIFWKDTNLVYLGCNSIFAQDVGFSSQAEIVGKNDFEMGWFNQAELYRSIDKQVIESGVPQFNIEESQTTPTGKITTLITSKIPLIDNNGKVIGILGTYTDITERKNAEAEIEKNREKYRGLSEASFEAIFFSEKGVCIEQNMAAELMFGYTTEEAITRFGTDWIVPEDREMVMNNMISGIEYAYEAMALRKDGTSFPCVLQGKMMQYKGRNVRVTSLVDITKRKKAFEALKISEEKYRTMLNASPDGILLLNLEGIITEASEIGLELFGADSKDELIGKEFNHFVPSEEISLAEEMFENTINEGLAQNTGLKIRKKNQSIFFSEISSTLIQALDGKPLSFMLIIRDITQRKKIETTKLHADRMTSLGEMASGIAHEVNQPLNIISMVMDKILFETAKTETINIEFLKNKSDRIFENITRIKNIIDHVRAFSRNGDNYVSAVFDINVSISNAISMITEQFKHIGIRLNLKLDKQIPPIFGNTYKFEQVIVNLLVNAKDALVEKKSKQKGFSDMTVGINTYQENQFLIVEITDNGIGINNDDMQGIMLPFYTTKEEGKGTGLGLSISYQIIQEMNGTIEITSNSLSGTKVKLKFDFQNKNLK